MEELVDDILSSRTSAEGLREALKEIQATLRDWALSGHARVKETDDGWEWRGENAAFHSRLLGCYRTYRTIFIVTARLLDFAARCLLCIERCKKDLDGICLYLLGTHPLTKRGSCRGERSSPPSMSNY
jgi:hypothetical protein